MTSQQAQTDLVAVRLTENNNVIAYGWDINEIKNLIAVVRKQEQLNDNEIGLFNLNGKQIVKRYKNREGKVILTEPMQPPINVKPNDNFFIFGRVIQSRITL